MLLLRAVLEKRILLLGAGSERSRVRNKFLQHTIRENLLFFNKRDTV